MKNRKLKYPTAVLCIAEDSKLFLWLYSPYKRWMVKTPLCNPARQENCPAVLFSVWKLPFSIKGLPTFLGEMIEIYSVLCVHIYESKIAVVPKEFQSRKSSRYLAAIELLAEYKNSKDKLQFAIQWLKENQKSNGKWDMGSVVNDKVYFPLSDNWRKAETRENDCTERVMKILDKLTE